MDVLITSNSPGELFSWVRPCLDALRERMPAARLVLGLLPCPYAAGSEAEVARTFPHLDEVMRPWETMRLLFLGSRRFARTGAVLFLGGDPWLAVGLARRLRYHLFGYSDRPRGVARHFTRVAVPSEAVRDKMVGRGVPRERIDCVGDLMVDGVCLQLDRGAARAQLAVPLEARLIGLFPGSRPPLVRATLAVFLRAAEEVAERVPEARFLLVQSPFIQARHLERALTHPHELGLPRARARVQDGALITERGLRVPLAEPTVLGALDCALTIPGTNTAQLACAGCPMVLALSARAPVPLSGLLGCLASLPTPWKERLRRSEYWRFRSLVAHPNIRAGRQVVPEVVLGAELGPLVETLVTLLQDAGGRAQLGAELRALMGPQGASRRLVESLEAGAERSG